MTVTPERLRDIVSTLVVAAEHRADTLTELCEEAFVDGETEAVNQYRADLTGLEAAIAEAREWLAVATNP